MTCNTPRITFHDSGGRKCAHQFLANCTTLLLARPARPHALRKASLGEQGVAFHTAFPIGACSGLLAGHVWSKVTVDVPNSCRAGPTFAGQTTYPSTCWLMLI